MEGRRNKKRKKEFRGKEGKKKQNEKQQQQQKSSAGFKPVRLVLLVCLSVEWEEVVGKIGFNFLPS